MLNVDLLNLKLLSFSEHIPPGSNSEKNSQVHDGSAAALSSKWLQYTSDETDECASPTVWRISEMTRRPPVSTADSTSPAASARIPMGSRVMSDDRGTPARVSPYPSEKTSSAPGGNVPVVHNLSAFLEEDDFEF